MRGCSITVGSRIVKHLLLVAAGVAALAAAGCSHNASVSSASQLVFSTQPGGTTAGSPISSVAISIEDSQGNPVLNAANLVTIAIGNNPAGGTLAGTLQVAAIDGVATFTGLSINNPGTGYTLTASSSGLTGATSNAFTISTAATKLVFTTQPGGGTGGVAWTQQPVVAVQDSAGNTVASSASITLAISSGTGTPGAALACASNPLAASSGVALFAGCEINLAGSSYTLTATATGLTSAVSTTFNVSIGPASQLGFVVQPIGTVGEMPSEVWTQQPLVAVQDSGGNTITSSSASITLAITTGTGTAGAVLSCTHNPLAASSGLAQFAGCEINLAGDYRITASSTGLTSAVSGPVDISTSGSGALPASCAGFPTGSESLVTGHWAALVQGWTGSTNFPVAAVFAFSTNGAGAFSNLDGNGTAGQMDEQNGSNGSNSYATFTVETTGSSYSVGQDPTSSGYVGCMTLATYNNTLNETGPTLHYVFTLGGISGSAASKGQIIEWDDATGENVSLQGVMLPQDSSQFAIASLQSYYATEQSGVNPNGTPAASVSSINLNTSTGAVSGVADSDDAGEGCQENPVSGGFLASSTIRLTGRLTASITPACAVVTDQVIYIVNRNELFLLASDPFTTQNAEGVPILSGRAIVTSHNGFSSSSLSGNYMFHETGIANTTAGGACQGNTENCASVTLGVVTPASAGADTVNFNGAAWQYQQGNIVTTSTIVNQAGAINPLWGRIALAPSGSNNFPPTLYLTTPVTGADATEPYAGFLIGAGTSTGSLDPTAPIGFFENAASSTVSTTSLSGDYFFGHDLSGDNTESTDAGVENLSSVGAVTGTDYSSNSSGLQAQPKSGVVTVTNGDPNGTGFAFPGLANTGPGTFAVTNGTRIILFQTGAAYGSPGTSGAQFTVMDQRQ